MHLKEMHEKSSRLLRKLFHFMLLHQVIKSAQGDLDDDVENEAQDNI